jgi:hypothetical protein
MKGLYRKVASRAGVESLPAAWEAGDRRAFAAARARCTDGIVLDRSLSGAAHRVLVLCLQHMNANERWSCFVSIPKLAEEAGCSRATCWRAIGDADGVHILTKRGTISRGHSRHDVTFITIHPRYSHKAGRESPRGEQKSEENQQPRHVTPDNPRPRAAINDPRSAIDAIDRVYDRIEQIAKVSALIPSEENEPSKVSNTIQQGLKSETTTSQKREVNLPSRTSINKPSKFLDWRGKERKIGDCLDGDLQSAILRLGEGVRKNSGANQTAATGATT